jgi:hypothetical protein
MRRIVWNPDKVALLRNTIARGGVGFEECIVAIEAGNILDVLENPSSNHPSQRIFVLEINGYAYCAPFIETPEEIFLKTVFPSRKFTALYLTERTS